MQRVSRCPKCREGIIKPDIVFFGEDLPPEFHQQMAADKNKVDLSLTLPLTERVVVGKDDQGNTTVKHPGEPQRVAGYLDPNWKPGAQGNTSEWIVPDGK